MARKLSEYECVNCGYSLARWRINLTGSGKDFCENCYHRYTSSNTHVEDFNLNRWNNERKKPLSYTRQGFLVRKGAARCQ